MCAVDGGAVAALAPVAKQLTQQGIVVSWVTTQNGVGNCQKKDIEVAICDDNIHASASFLEIHTPDILVCGVTGNSADITLFMAQAAMKMNIPTVKVVDFYGTGHPHEAGFAPTVLCVFDEASRSFEANTRTMDINRVKVTGSPAFDALVDVRPLPSETFLHPLVLMVMPSNLARVREFVDVVTPTLRLLAGPIVLGVSVHPKSLPPKGDVIQEELYLELQNCSPLIHLMKDNELRAKGNNAALIASALLVLGTTSTELVQACYLRRPAISVLPACGPNELLLTSRGLRGMPTSECGATLRVENAEALQSLMAGVLFQGAGVNWDLSALKMKRAQEVDYYLDGRNADRICRVVTSLL